MKEKEEVSNEAVNGNFAKPMLADSAIEKCICTTDCLGCYHKDRKCKKLRGHDR